jgi:hypothetical protein
LDSSTLGGSARALGMGGMFLNIKGDPASIVNNPAGLAPTKQFQFFAMGTKLLQEVNYFATVWFSLLKISVFLV